MRETHIKYPHSTSGTTPDTSLVPQLTFNGSAIVTFCPEKGPEAPRAGSSRFRVPSSREEWRFWQLKTTFLHGSMLVTVNLTGKFWGV